MKGMNTLIKINQRNLDKLRKELVQKEEEKEQLIELSAKLYEELMRERAVAVEMPTMAAYMADFEKRVKQRQLEIAKEVIKTDAQLAHLAAAITETFGELKKYEITKANFLERQKAAADKREQNMLDDVGMQQFSRREE